MAKKRRVLEPLPFLAANSAIAHSICGQGGLPLLLQLVAEPNDAMQLEAAETLQSLMVHQCAQVRLSQCCMQSRLFETPVHRIHHTV